MPARHVYLALCRVWDAREVKIVKILGEELSVLAPDAFALELEEEGEVALLMCRVVVCFADHVIWGKGPWISGYIHPNVRSTRPSQLEQTDTLTIAPVVRLAA